LSPERKLTAKSEERENNQHEEHIGRSTEVAEKEKLAFDRTVKSQKGRHRSTSDGRLLENEALKRKRPD
jgi:hypothetical protein